MAEAIRRIVKREGTWTKIHNKSAQPISLNAYLQGNTANSRLPRKVISDLARNIEPGNYEVVKREKYIAKGGGSQICILFRAGKFGDGVQPATDEKPLIHDELPKNSDWNLSLDEKEKVIDLDKASRPVHMKMTQISAPNADGTQTNPELQTLRDEVMQLREEVNALRKRIEVLEGRPCTA